MRRRTPLLEWQFVENQEGRGYAPWPPAVDRMPSVLADQRRLDRRYIWRGFLSLLLLLASAGGWLWFTAQAGLAQIEGELDGALQIELASIAPIDAPRAVTSATDSAAMAWHAQLERERHILHRALLADTLRTPLGITVNMTNLRDDLAVTNFVTAATGGRQAYRQTCFYRNTAEGWLRIQPVDDLWGAPRSLASTHFIWHFRQNDAQVVAAVAPQIDALYAELQRNFGLAPNVEKLLIEVSVERTTGTTLTPRWHREALVVPSPAIYLAPVELSDAALLAQSIALPLIDYMGESAIEDHAIPLHWWPLLDSLHLWQLWDVDMPLAQWRHDVVKWLYTDVATDDPERHSMLPVTYSELCTMHSLWMLTPVLVGIPLECVTSDAGTWIASRWLTHMLRTHLDQLRTPLTGYYDHYDEDNYLFRSTETVALATLFEYAVATYGHEQLPVLLAGLAQYDDRDTLLIAVYGVSSSEFEEGWRAYLVEEYGFQPNLLRP